jgi:UPF0755 protein
MENQTINTIVKNRNLLWATIIGIVLAIIAVFVYVVFFQTAQKNSELEQFTIPNTTVDDSYEIAGLLKEKGFVKSSLAFRIAFSGLSGITSRCVDCIESGAYKISKSMSAYDIANIIKKGPYMEWVTIQEGLRKEEIADILAYTFLWTFEEKDKWINTYTALDYDHTEGVYFPDTYLIPVNEAPLDVAKRLRAKFEEKFAPYAKEAVKQNIKWTTVIKLASIVQREAANKNDMPLVAGILWNRLFKNMRLEVDSTLQYVRGDIGKGWWAPITVVDKQIDSSYNTYKNAGLPPHPISNPGIEAIKASLYPATTTCLYYLHDSAGVIHCSDTYEGHLENIKNYLK